ncbi:hypothetical protein [Actinoplanes sp. URMC 104]|uniref:hypothetical protein n=1 Tax=Actinoplanes sp. URMC 104 TaxID=3423409 RepID=UPI003F1AB65A
MAAIKGTSARVFTKKGPDGETLERHVYSAADEVAARFDGFTAPADADSAKKPAAQASTSSTASSPKN